MRDCLNEKTPREGKEKSYLSRQSRITIASHVNAHQQITSTASRCFYNKRVDLHTSQVNTCARLNGRSSVRYIKFTNCKTRSSATPQNRWRKERCSTRRHKKAGFNGIFCTGLRCTRCTHSCPTSPAIGITVYTNNIHWPCVHVSSQAIIAHE
jgi:hypothetical protein